MVKLTMPRAGSHEILRQDVILFDRKETIVFGRDGFSIQLFRFRIHIRVDATVFPQHEISPKISFQRPARLDAFHKHPKMRKFGPILLK
jgi:hypothetical protein